MLTASIISNSECQVPEILMLSVRKCRIFRTGEFCMDNFLVDLKFKPDCEKPLPNNS
jgi:hypothetical protein